MEIVPLIPKVKRGFPPTIPLAEIINTILYYHYRKYCLSKY